MIPSSEIRREILREYNKDPIGWRVLTSRDIRGHIDIIFSHRGDVWFLKEEHVNPFEAVGFGVREKMPEVKGSLQGLSFGFRPVTGRMMGEIWRAVEREDDVGRIISSLLNQKPIPINRIRAPAVLEGPVVTSPKPLEVFPEQRNLDIKLRSELDKLISRKYPHLITTYG